MTQVPFSAIVAMDDMRLALILNAVSPAIGGVLVRGEKGTAKSTAVRALTAVLPPVAVVGGCRFSCDPAAPDPDEDLLALNDALNRLAEEDPVAAKVVELHQFADLGHEETAAPHQSGGADLAQEVQAPSRIEGVAESSSALPSGW